MKNSFLKATGSSWGQRALALIHDTPAEIWIGAVIFGAAAGAYGYKVNAEKAERIPVAFSEIGKTLKQFRLEGKTVPPLTKFYASTNDAVMKVFEAHNVARSFSNTPERFASELENKIDRALKIHRLLSEYASEIPDDSRNALQSLSKLTEAGKDLPAIISALAKAWEEDHDDIYRTERWTEKECDSQGNNCREVEHSREVYDYTIHKYTYHLEQGRKADRLIRDFLKNHPDLRIEERLLLAKETDVHNEFAIEQSMKRELNGKIPTPEQSLSYANMWATGSNLTKYQPVILVSHSDLSDIAPKWAAAAGAARSHRYTTHSRTDDGPKEFQTAQKALNYAQTMNSGIRSIADGVGMAGHAVPLLGEKIKEFIGVTLDGKPGNSKKLKAEVLDLAKTIYKSNYENGLDVEPFKWDEVLLYIVLGAIIGGAVGWGADRYGNSRQGLSPRI